MASMVTELMTPLMPGAGPPPTTSASLPPFAFVMKTPQLVERPMPKKVSGTFLLVTHPPSRTRCRVPDTFFGHGLLNLVWNLPALSMRRRSARAASGEEDGCLGWLDFVPRVCPKRAQDPWIRCKD